MRNSYTRRRFGALLGVSPLALSILSTVSQSASAADDVLETAINAYIYGYPLALISSTARSPERIAPSMKDGQAVDVSVPTQCSGPTGARTAERNKVVAPGVRNPVKQPRVHCWVDQFISWYSIGLSAFGPKRLAISSSTSFLRSAADRDITFRARPENIKRS